MIEGTLLLKTLIRLHYSENIFVQFSLKKIPPTHVDSLISESSHQTIVDSIHITPDKVHSELCRLNINKSCGADSITPFLLKSAADYISMPICCLFNKSLSTGTLLFNWISGNIVPIHKRNDKHNPSSYRPISPTSVVIKVFECILQRHLVSVLERHHVLGPSQSGFRNKRSTLTLLAEAIDDWSQCLEQHSTVHCLLVDFAKAVPHDQVKLFRNLW